MRSAILLGLLAPLTAVLAAEEVKTEYLLSHSCKRAVVKGDQIAVHYTGTLLDGTKFDSSLDRGDPLRFPIGHGAVIQGWDNGLIGMCPGDKWKLTIPSELAYGERGIGPIPPGATLVFETELMEIVGAPAEERVVIDKASEPEPKAESAPEASESTEAAAKPTDKEEL